MNIYAKKGDRVICDTFNAGYPDDQEIAKEYLEIGGIYTVETTIVHRWHTEVFLQEFPDVSFNSVFFEDCPEEVA